MANKTFSELEKFVNSLKSDLRFKILEDNNPHGFGDGVDYWSFTTLESSNLKITYAQQILGGCVTEDEITIIDKNKDVYVYSTSVYAIDKPIKQKRFTIGELTKYIDENV